jgi:hypothetical protein
LLPLVPWFVIWLSVVVVQAALDSPAPMRVAVAAVAASSSMVSF